MKKTITAEQALNRAAALCSQAERCPADIFAKVQSWGLGEQEAARIVARLEHEGFLDERRYVRAFVADKFRFEHWGRVKIGYALRGKGIGEALVSEALAEVIDPDEYLEACVALLTARLRTLAQPLSLADRARLYRFAAQRGYESPVIAHALDVCLS